MRLAFEVPMMPGLLPIRLESHAQSERVRLSLQKLLFLEQEGIWVCHRLMRRQPGPVERILALIFDEHVVGTGLARVSECPWIVGLILRHWWSVPQLAGLILRHWWSLPPHLSYGLFLTRVT